MQRAVDVVIVGSGVCGGLVAARLASQGVKVLILEAGPRVKRPEALAQYRAALIKVPESPYPNAPYAPRSSSDQPDSYYLQNGPDKFESTYLRQVGGTTWHWLGTALRFVPDDFRLKSKFGVGLDWPLTYDDLEPWYCEAEREMGVAGDSNAALDAPRSKPYPLPVDSVHLRRSARRRRAGGHRVHAAADAAGAQLTGLPESRGLLRQRHLHSDLSGRREVRRDRSRRDGRARGRGAHRAGDRVERGDRRGRPRQRRALQAARTAATAAPWRRST